MKINNRIAIQALLSNSIIHFDTALYGFLATVFAKLFFSQENEIANIIIFYGMFAISYIGKPIGSYIFTKMITKVSPIHCMKRGLMCASITMCLLACTPTYSSIGCSAVLLLFMMRIALAFFAGGSLAILRVLLTSHSSSYKQSTYYEMSTIAGIIFASIAGFIVMQDIDLWRFVYLIAGVTGILNCFIINNIHLETLTKVAETNYQLPKKKIAIIIVNRILGNVTYYIPFILINDIVPLINTGITSYDMSGQNILFLIIDFLFLSMVARLHLKSEPTKVLNTSYIALAIVSPVIFLYLSTATITCIFVAKTSIVIIGVLITVVHNIFFNSFFEASNMRYAMVGNSIAISDALLGKATPAICMMLYYQTGSVLAIGVYISAISLLCVAINKCCA